jgi:hypothetical protein
MKTIIKYSLLVLFLFAANNSFATDTDDNYSFKFIEKKLYKAKTDKWIYQIFKNEKPYKKLNVYVKENLEDVVIFVKVNYNNSENAYYYNKRATSNNFKDAYRLKEETVYSIQEAVNLAVLHYMQDQMID